MFFQSMLHVLAQTWLHISMLLDILVRVIDWLSALTLVGRWLGMRIGIITNNR